MGIQINGQNDTIVATDGSMNITSTVTGDVTGNVTGNLTGNVTGNLTGNVNAGVVTATSSIVVGDKFISYAGVGVGTTTTEGRNAGVGTAQGTLTYNTTTGNLEAYGRDGWVNVKTLTTFGGLTASGGIIGDYTDPGTGNIYRSHTFNTSGAFSVTALSSDYPNTVDILSVGGGGGGGWAGTESAGIAGSGGGGGGVHYRTSINVAVSSYPVTIGAGGAQGASGGPTSSPLAPFTAAGGGGGGEGPAQSGDGGASSGGGSHPGGLAGTASGAPGHPGAIDVVSPTPNADGWGNTGSAPSGGFAGDGSGGGGAGSAGLQHSTSSTNPGDGGNGARYSTAFGPGNIVSYGGGGSGGVHNGPIPDASTLDSRPSALRGGGGFGGPNPGSVSSNGNDAGNGVPGLGGGGGGAGNRRNETAAGRGGAGTFIVRYQIGASQTGTAKASGGRVSFYGGKTIHTFLSSSTFTVPASFNETVEYVVLGGGGGAVKGDVGGGGGAGGYLTGTTPISTPQTITVTVGSGGVQDINSNATQGTPGGNSSFGSPITAYGGGGGQRIPGTIQHGGSGGGGGYNTSTAGYGLNPSTPAPVIASFPLYTPGTTQGYPGGGQNTVGPGYGSGGGGGAGGAGQSGTPSVGGNGGIGVRIPSTFQNPAQEIGTPGPAGNYFYVGGGGGGSRNDNGTLSSGGYGGGGNGGSNNQEAQDGVAHTGGGGGASEIEMTSNRGRGGSGIVIIAYPT
jgi:hypothetical protein